MDEFFIPILICSAVVVIVGGIVAQIVAEIVSYIIVAILKKHKKLK